MKLDEVLSAAGTHKPRKRIGRGRGSGHGKTSGRGTKGYGARAGSRRRFGYEGGQNSQLRRIPKRGFNNESFARPVTVVNIGELCEVFEDGSRVDAQTLHDKGLVTVRGGLIKVLGDGECSRKLTVSVNRVSKSAAEKIQAAGGSVELLG